MNTDLLNEKKEKLDSALLQIMYMKPEERVINPSLNELSDLKDALNGIFDENNCLDVVFTNNTDKQMFGIRVNPIISNTDVMTILFSDNTVKMQNYQLELDSKIFEAGLDESELSALIIFEISSMVGSYDTIDKLRFTIDSKMLSDDDVICIRDSVNYAQLIIFAIKDTLHKLTSFLFKEDDELALNYMIQALDLQETIVLAKNKIISASLGANDSMRNARPVIFEWMLVMYRNMKTNSRIIISTLKDAKAFTASKFDIAEIDKVISAVERIDTNIAYTNESMSLNKFFESNNISAVNELSLFKNLKKNGLRGLENELYEYTMRVKNCTDRDEAVLVMRGINSRIGLIEDYLANEVLSDNDYKHWSNVANQYRDLRIQLSKKKLNDKSYGLFYRYDRLDDDDMN